MVERLALVSSGGLGPEVTPVLRAAALPGADLFISTTAGPAARIGSLVGRGLGAVGMRPDPDVAEVARGYASLADADRRAAFLASVRAVIGTGGQLIDAADRLYLAEGLPVLILWGSRDPIIPLRHAEDAQRAISGSSLEILDDVGHVPQLEAPGRFLVALEAFLQETEPARFDADEWRARLGAA